MPESAKLQIACAVAALLAGFNALAAEHRVPVDDGRLTPASATRSGIPQIKPISHAPPVIPALETSVASTVNAGFATTSVFSPATGVTANAQTLSPPVTISYNGSASALQVTETGTGKAIQTTISNAASNSSALYGTTNGGGAGLTGYNSGTKGPGGKFGVTNAVSSQPGVFGTTNGTGPAVLGVITNSSSNYPAIYGQNPGSLGVGVEGDGTSFGVYGTSPNGNGMFGHSFSGSGVVGLSDSGYGIYGASNSNVGVRGYSSSALGVVAESTAGDALHANADGSGRGIVAHSVSGIGIYASSDTFYGVWGQSANQFAVVGWDAGNGIGVYGHSDTGYAGDFDGPVIAASYTTSSDRNLKTHFKPIDGKDILARVNRLPITTWDFKRDVGKHHVGPMAQDFHAAFGLDGDDDTHINLTDIAGISLAAIQELSSEVKAKDAQIAELTQKLKSLEDTLSARLAVLERRDVATTQTASLRR